MRQRFAVAQATSSRVEATGATIAVWTAAVAVSAQSVVGLVNELTVESTWLNPDIERSLFQLVSAAVTASAGAAAFAAAVVSRARIRLAALGLALTYFAVDDLLALHESAGEALGERAFGLPGYLAVRLWIVILLPLLVLAFLGLAAEAMVAGRRLRLVLVAGLGLLVAAVAVELMGAITRAPRFLERVGGKAETLRVLVEEGLELGGWWLIAAGLWTVFAGRVLATKGEAEQNPELVVPPVDDRLVRGAPRERGLRDMRR